MSEEFVPEKSDQPCVTIIEVFISLTIPAQEIYSAEKPEQEESYGKKSDP